MCLGGLGIGVFDFGLPIAFFWCGGVGGGGVGWDQYFG